MEGKVNMQQLDFAIELNSDGISDELEYELFVEAEERLRDLASAHSDFRGAAVSIREPVHGETSYLYEVTVVAYARPENIAATEKGKKPILALKGALSAVEKQIREKRERLGQSWKQARRDQVTAEIVETASLEETSQPNSVEWSVGPGTDEGEDNATQCS
jgi:ribosome-associated translation inhibitor RaiA